MEIVCHICVFSMGSHMTLALHMFFFFVCLYTNEKVNHFCLAIPWSAQVCRLILLLVRSQGAQTVIYSIENKTPKKERNNLHVLCTYHSIAHFIFWNLNWVASTWSGKHKTGSFSLYLQQRYFFLFRFMCKKNPPKTQKQQQKWRCVRWRKTK